MHIRQLLTMVVPFAVVVACGGKGQSAPKAGPSALPAELSGADASGTPRWVQRGSIAVVADDGRRVFYGVGSASGIRNPALLRTTADNRARNELGKIFEVFSASLMKDYMASSGEQQVEQAVKTLNSGSLEGTEVVDRYIAGDGTLYALAALDLKKVSETIARAKELGAVKSYTQKVSVDDIFDAHAKKEAPPAAPPAMAGSEAGAGAGQGAASASGAKSRKGGARPAWIDGSDPSYPNVRYLCAVGYGPKRDIGENGAYSALSRVFVSRVESVSKDFMSAYSKTGAQSLETQSSETLTKVSTEKVFSGVRIFELWEDKDGTIFALACLERGPASARLREQIQENDGRAGAQLEKAKALDKMSRVRALAQALQALTEREALNGELRLVDTQGVGVSGPYSHADVADALEGAVQALRVGVAADGPYADDFRGALIDALTKRGYLVSEFNKGDEPSLDVLVSAKIRVEDGGSGSGSAASLYFARGVIQVEVKNIAQGKVLGSVNDSEKAGHRSKEEAERKAVRDLAKKIVQQVGTKIDKAMKGT